MPTSRFVVAGTNYDYATDEIKIEDETDGKDLRRLDEVIENDRNEQRYIIEFKSVPESANANSDGVGAAELYQLIQTEVVQNNNTVKFIPDISISSGFNTNPPQVQIVPMMGGKPVVYKTEKGQDRLIRTMKFQSASWLDPTDTTVGGDKETIDDLNDLQGTI